MSRTASDDTPPRHALVTCCPRSGSTVVAHLLNVHPGILSVHELQLHKPNDKGRFRRIVTGHLFSRLPLKGDTPNLLGSMWDVSRSPVRRLLLALAAWRGQGALARELVRNAARDEIEYIIDKLPDPSLIGLYRERYADPKIIYLHRNPFAVVNSMMKKSAGELLPGVNWGPPLEGVDEGMSVESLAVNVYLQCLRWLRAFQSEPGDIHEICFEDFVADPERVYLGVFEFLGVKLSDRDRETMNRMFTEFPPRRQRSEAWRKELSPVARDRVSQALARERTMLPERYRSLLDSLTDQRPELSPDTGGMVPPRPGG